MDPFSPLTLSSRFPLRLILNIDNGRPAFRLGALAIWHSSEIGREISPKTVRPRNHAIVPKSAGTPPIDWRGMERSTTSIISGVSDRLLCTLDLRLAWRLNDPLPIRNVGQNLVDDTIGSLGRHRRETRPYRAQRIWQADLASLRQYALQSRHWSWPSAAPRLSRARKTSLPLVEQDIQTACPSTISCATRSGPPQVQAARRSRVHLWARPLQWAADGTSRCGTPVNQRTIDIRMGPRLFGSRRLPRCIFGTPTSVGDGPACTPTLARRNNFDVSDYVWLCARWRNDRVHSCPQSHRVRINVEAVQRRLTSASRIVCYGPCKYVPRARPMKSPCHVCPARSRSRPLDATCCLLIGSRPDADASRLLSALRILC